MTIFTITSWIGGHANKVSAAVWSLVLAAVAMGWVTLTEQQLAVWGLVLSNALALFVETNTVSKVRVGERIDAGVEKELVARIGTGGHISEPERP